MSKQRSVALGALTAIAVGTGKDISDGETADVWVSGTFVGTVLVQASPDGTNWVTVANGSLTAPGVVPIPTSAKQVRINCTAYTSGTITGTAALRDAELRG